MRRHLTFANVTSVLALFIALGGTSYAVATIGTKQIKNNSVRSATFATERSSVEM